MSQCNGKVQYEGSVESGRCTRELGHRHACIERWMWGSGETAVLIDGISEDEANQIERYLSGELEFCDRCDSSKKAESPKEQAATVSIYRPSEDGSLGFLGEFQEPIDWKNLAERYGFGRFVIPRSSPGGILKIVETEIGPKSQKE